MTDKPRIYGEHGRIKLSMEQIRVLSEFYNHNKRPGNRERVLLAEKLRIGIDKVKNWFQNRRAKDRKDLLEAMQQECLNKTSIKSFRPNIYPNCNDLYRRRDI